MKKLTEILHIDHFEDLLIKADFYAFRDIALGVLTGSDDLTYQLKIDGSPSLFFGIDPMDRRFFLSTKSLFNKNPKIVKDHYDIDMMFHDGLRNVLPAALDCLGNLYLEPGVVYQGDVIFGDKRLINGSISFTPNIITYTVDPSSPFYENINSAQFGIVVHTKYEIERRTSDRFYLKTIPYDFETLVAQSGGELFITSNIIPKPQIPDTDIELQLKWLHKVINNNNILEDLVRRDKKITRYIQTFVNSQMDQEGIFDDVLSGRYDSDKYLYELIDHCMLEYHKDTIKRDAADHYRLRDRMYKTLLRKKDNITLFIWCYYQMIKIKHDIMSMFNYGIFEADNHEGIVITSKNNVVKLVNRTGFSRQNRKNVGVFLGRMQGLTTGHKKVIEAMNKKHPKSYVAVIRGIQSSADGSLNPFPYEVQARMIKRVLPSNVELIQIRNLDDLAPKLDSKKFTIYSGPERMDGYRRFTGYINGLGYSVKLMDTGKMIPRDERISGTKLRQSLRDNNFDVFKSIAPKEIWDMFEELRVFM